MHKEPLFSSHMVDLSEEPVNENLDKTAEIFEQAAKMNQFLEMEIGITGGEEDGVNNEDVKDSSLYTQPQDIYEIYKRLSAISPNFSIAAGFGNVHGVYKPGNVRLRPELLKDHQAYVKKEESLKDDKPVFLVFHGGSGSELKDFQEAISYGVVKVVCDTIQHGNNRADKVEPRHRSPIRIPNRYSRLRSQERKISDAPNRKPRGRGTCTSLLAERPTLTRRHRTSQTRSTTIPESGSARARRR